MPDSDPNSELRAMRREARETSRALLHQVVRSHGKRLDAHSDRIAQSERELASLKLMWAKHEATAVGTEREIRAVVNELKKLFSDLSHDFTTARIEAARTATRVAIFAALGGAILSAVFVWMLEKVK